MKLSLALFSVTFLTGLTLAQRAEAIEVVFNSLPHVDYKLCASVFSYKHMEYLGCIEVDSPGKPWCQLAKPHGKTKKVRGFCKVDSIPTALSVDKKGGLVKCNPWSSTPLGKVHGCYAENTGSKKYLCDVGRKSVQCDGLPKDDSIEHSIHNEVTARRLEQGKGNEVVATAVAVHSTQIKSNDNNLPKGLIAGLASAGCVCLLAAGLFVARKRSISRQIKTQLHKTSTLESNKSTNLLSDHVLIERKTQSNGPFLVVSTYTPTLGDEIEILPGDMVTMLSEYSDGWAQGINETRGKVKGVFPKHCLEPWA